MADSQTSTYSFVKPEVGASEDTWGGKLNGNWDDVDDLLDGTTVQQGPKIDSAMRVVDATDNTKEVAFSASGISTGTTRTFTWPNANGTILTDTDLGSSVQAYDAGLASIAGLTTAANKMIYTTAADTYAVADLTAFGRSLIDDADAATARTTLGVAIGTDVQAQDAVLQDLADLTLSTGDILYWDGSNLVNLGAGTEGQVLKQGATVPEWGDQWAQVGYAIVDDASASFNVAASSGFSSITRSGTGVYVFTFSTARSDTNYIISGITESSGGIDRGPCVASKSTTGFTLNQRVIGTGSLIDAEFTVTVVEP